MAAGLEQTNAAHDHATDDEFALQQFDQRDAASDNITPRFVSDRCDAQLLSRKLEDLLFNQADCFVRTICRTPRLAEKAVSFQPTIRACARLGNRNHRAGRIRRDEYRNHATAPCRRAWFESTPEFRRRFPRENFFALRHISPQNTT